MWQQNGCKIIENIFACILGVCKTKPELFMEQQFFKLLKHIVIEFK